MARSWDEVSREIERYKLLDETLVKRACDAAGPIIRQSDEEWVKRTIEKESREYHDKINELKKELHRIDPARYRLLNDLCPKCGGRKDSLKIKCMSCKTQLISNKEANQRRQADLREKAKLHKKYLFTLIVGFIIGTMAGLVLQNLIVVLICPWIALGIYEWKYEIDIYTPIDSLEGSIMGLVALPFYLIWKILFASPFWGISSWRDANKKT